MFSTSKFCNPQGLSSTKLTHADSINNPLLHYHHVKPLVQDKAKATQIDPGIFVIIEGMEDVNESRYEVLQKRVDPAKLEQVIVGWHPPVTIASGLKPASDKRTEACKTIQKYRSAT